MSGDGRLRESRANIVIVPTTTTYEIESSQRDRGPRKRGHLDYDWSCHSFGYCSSLLHDRQS